MRQIHFLFVILKVEKSIYDDGKTSNSYCWWERA